MGAPGRPVVPENPIRAIRGWSSFASGPISPETIYEHKSTVPRVAMIWPPKTLAHELRQQADVVDVGMGQEYGIDGSVKIPAQTKGGLDFQAP
jgi:hypothetical protein